MSKRKTTEEEMSSHKLIEKKRRDRINNCLSSLTQIVPAAFSKQTSGKLEKAEILEMTVDYLRVLHASELGNRFEQGEWFTSDVWSDFAQHYHAGYSDCIQQVTQFLSGVNGTQQENIKCQGLITYLQGRCRPQFPSSGCLPYTGVNPRRAADNLQPGRAMLTAQGNQAQLSASLKKVSMPTSPKLDTKVFGRDNFQGIARLRARENMRYPIFERQTRGHFDPRSARITDMRFLSDQSAYTLLTYPSAINSRNQRDV